MDGDKLVFTPESELDRGNLAEWFSFLDANRGVAVRFEDDHRRALVFDAGSPCNRGSQASYRGSGPSELLNIDRRNPNAITLFNAYGSPAQPESDLPGVSAVSRSIRA